MFGVSNNPDSIVLYFTDIQETASPYFEHIPLEQKSLRKFDYQQDIANLIKTYEKSSDIHHLQQIFEPSRDCRRQVYLSQAAAGA